MSTMAIAARRLKRHFLYRPCDGSETDHTWTLTNFTTDFEAKESPIYNCTALNIDVFFVLRRENNDIIITARLINRSIPIYPRPEQIRFDFAITTDKRHRLRHVMKVPLFMEDKIEYPEMSSLSRTQKFCSATKIFGLAQNKALHLAFRASLFNQQSEDYQRVEIDDLEEKMIGDMESLWFSNKFADVTIKTCDNLTFRAHKIILYARCPYFEMMFEDDKENDDDKYMQYMMNNNNEMITKDRVIVCEFDGITIREILRFLYTGQVANIDTTADLLICAANKYNLDQLHILCERVLVRSINDTNVFNYLEVAVKSNAKRLLNIAIAYLLCYAETVCNNKCPRLIASSLKCLSELKREVIYSDLVDCMNISCKELKEQENILRRLEARYADDWEFVKNLKSKKTKKR